MTDLSAFIAATPLADTHEHLHSEEKFLAESPDVLQDLFDHYTQADLRVAGATPEALKKLTDASDPDLAGRFLGVRAAWEAIQHTGYGQAVRLTAKRVYGLDELVPEALPAAQKIAESFRRPGERLRLLRDIANLSYVQIDDFRWECTPSDDGFFQYDISVVGLVQGNVPEGCTTPDAVREHIGARFAQWAPKAIAIKSQHAYNRTLLWQARTDSEIAPLLGKTEHTESEKLALGDWMFSRCIEEATRHELPIKIHTGYYAGHSYMPIERVPSGLLTGLLRAYPAARFVLMHTSYPYGHEQIALAKHFPNVFLDLCWAWSIDPYATRDFVRHAIHAVPANKLFAFGGDSFWPNVAVSYAFQARTWLTRALQAEVDEALLTEKQAIAVAGRWMGGNQAACFNLPQ
ncbi:amidohydrolase family protein [Armatimonas rosea]|uniref:Putative TIM-barrel fold metal-dependent hydrolase n=1 Tax=Armatimonas rosea TaxID=685828 RepID=A0A7W9SKP9_ARMRO|nr:amidohydrolase family protein [Armatimonas rosea]MBB6048396.1 putative TIM-barrel fold metal-dependent hydrolase [Armatimonas rosea]